MSGETFTVVLSPEAFAIVCGLVAPNDEVESVGILSLTDGVWRELSNKFPIENFRNAVARGLVEYDPDFGT